MTNTTWKLVPVEPTDEMLEAAAIYRRDIETNGRNLRTSELYDALLAAVPAAPVDEARTAYAYACELACSLHRKHYPEVTQWASPMEDLYGVLSQIDNMTTGLARAQLVASETGPAEGAN